MNEGVMWGCNVAAWRGVHGCWPPEQIWDQA
jgi:hypothetical protein